MRNALLALLAVLLLAPMVEARARFMGAADLPVATVYIANPSDKLIRFELSDNGKDWNRFRLAAKAGESAYSDRVGAKALFVRLWTNGTSVAGKMEFGHRYQVYWNQDRRLWDVAELQAQ